MTWESIANTIRQRFQAQVAEPLELVTQYDNQDLENPDNETWCRLTVKSGETMQMSIGNPQGNRERTAGVAIAQLFCPIGKGDGDLRKMADAVRSAFRRLTVNGVTFRTPYIQEPGRSGDEWQINVVCPWYADDIA